MSISSRAGRSWLVLLAFSPVLLDAACTWDKAYCAEEPCPPCVDNASYASHAGHKCSAFAAQFCTMLVNRADMGYDMEKQKLHIMNCPMTCGVCSCWDGCFKDTPVYNTTKDMRERNLAAGVSVDQWGIPLFWVNMFQEVVKLFSEELLGITFKNAPVYQMATNTYDIQFGTRGEMINEKLSRTHEFPSTGFNGHSGLFFAPGKYCRKNPSVGGPPAGAAGGPPAWVTAGLASGQSSGTPPPWVTGAGSSSTSGDGNSSGAGAGKGAGSGGSSGGSAGTPPPWVTAGSSNASGAGTSSEEGSGKGAGAGDSSGGSSGTPPPWVTAGSSSASGAGDSSEEGSGKGAGAGGSSNASSTGDSSEEGSGKGAGAGGSSSSEGASAGGPPAGAGGSSQGGPPSGAGGSSQGGPPAGAGEDRRLGAHDGSGGGGGGTPPPWVTEGGGGSGTPPPWVQKMLAGGSSTDQPTGGNPISAEECDGTLEPSTIDSTYESIHAFLTDKAFQDFPPVGFFCEENENDTYTDWSEAFVDTDVSANEEALTAAQLQARNSGAKESEYILDIQNRGGCPRYIPPQCVNKQCMELIVRMGSGGNVMYENIHYLVDKLKLPFHVLSLNMAMFEAAVEKAGSNGIVFLAAGPTPVLTKVNAKRIAVSMEDSACNSDNKHAVGFTIGCDKPQTSFHSALKSTVRTKAPELYNAIKNKIRISAVDFDEMVADHQDAGGNYTDYREITCKWMKKNVEKVKTWFPEGCLSKPGLIAYMDAYGKMRCCDGELKQLVVGGDKTCVPNCDLATQTPSVSPESCVQRCEEGQVYNPSTGGCDLCPAGTAWSPQADPLYTGVLSTCTQCMPGTHSSTNGSLRCSICETGSFAPQGSSECYDCPNGTQGTSAGQEQCRCKKGYYREGGEAGVGEVCWACPLQHQTTEFMASTSPEHCKCDVGFYEHLGSGGQCEACPPGMDCNVLGEQPVAQSGHMALEEDPLYSYKCGVELHCPGGKPGTCLEGRPGTSLACARCPEGQKTKDGQCVECSDEDKSAWWILIVAILLLTPAAFNATKAPPEKKQESNDEAESKQTQAAGGVGTEKEGEPSEGEDFGERNSLGSRESRNSATGRRNSDKVKVEAGGKGGGAKGGSTAGSKLGSTNLGASLLTTSGALGMTLGGLQIFSVFAGLGLEWPEAFRDLLDFLNVFTCDLSVLGGECITNDSVGLYLNRVLLFPCILGLIALFMVCSWLIPKEKLRWTMAETYNFVGQVVQAFYTTMCFAAVVPIVCYNHPDTKKKSVREYSDIICWQTRDHTTMLTVGIILLAGILFFAILSIRNVLVAPAKSKSSPAFMKANRYLFYRFRIDAWYWGLVLLARSVAICATSVLFPDDPHAQMLFIVLVFAVSLALHVSVWPWRIPLLNALEGLVLVCLLGITTAGSKLTNYTPAMIFAYTFAAYGSLLTVMVMGILAGLVPEKRKRQFQNAFNLGVAPNSTNLSTDWDKLSTAVGLVDPKRLAYVMDLLPLYDVQTLRKTVEIMSEIGLGEQKPKYRLDLKYAGATGDLMELKKAGSRRLSEQPVEKNDAPIEQGDVHLEQAGVQLEEEEEQNDTSEEVTVI